MKYEFDLFQHDPGDYEGTFEIEAGDIMLVHDTIWPGVVNIIFPSGACSVQKNEKFDKYFSEQVYKKPNFVKTYTRFDPNQASGFVAEWGARQRYLLYYRPFLPIIKTDSKNIIPFYWGQFHFEK